MLILNTCNSPHHRRCICKKNPCRSVILSIRIPSLPFPGTASKLQCVHSFTQALGHSDGVISFCGERRTKCTVTLLISSVSNTLTACSVCVSFPIQWYRSPVAYSYSCLGCKFHPVCHPLRPQAY